MSGETNLQQLLKTIQPTLHPGDYVFCTVASMDFIDRDKIISFFRETEGMTIIIQKKLADELHLNYSFVASWITLMVHSSLEAIGLTAAFSTALAGEGISCNVVAAFYHDHIFVKQDDAIRAMDTLQRLSAEI